MKKYISLVLVTAFLIVSNVCNAAKPESVAKVVELMHSKAAKGFVHREFDPDGSVQIVFVWAGQRYTFWHTGNERLNYLSVWVRPNGTHQQKEMQTFTDHTIDGEVDFGITGRDGSDEERKSFDSGRDGSEQAGEQYLAHWQQLYDRAITTALRRLKIE